MPRLYIDVSSFLGHPAALTFPTQIAQIQANSGALDKLLARASRRVDSACRKRIQAPPTTTVASPGVSAGATSLPVTSTLGFDNGMEEAVLLGTGGIQELIPISPGGIAVTRWVSPYPGNIVLATPTQYSHSAGETVQGCYQEISTVGSVSSSDDYSNSLFALDQASQLAAAHAPHMNTSGLVRVLFLKHYPIMSLIKLEHMLSFTVSYGTLDINSVGIVPGQGILRLIPGSFVTPEGMMRATYSAGYVNVPEEAQQAAAWYAADELQTMKSMGAADSLTGKQRFRWGQAGPGGGKSLYVQRAEEAINDSGLKRMT